MSFLLNKFNQDSKLFKYGLVVGGVCTLTATAWYIVKLKNDIRLLEKYSNLKPKSGMIDLIGKTPIIELKTLSEYTGCRIYAKMENQNPGRSVKDRAALHIVEDAIQAGELKTGDNLYESTSGSTGISLGLMCNVKGINSRIYLNNDLAEEKYNILELIGCQLYKVPPLNLIDSQSFVKRGRTEAEQDPKGFYADQFQNLSNFKGHYNHTGPEIYDQMEGELDYFITGAGTGATLAGVSLFLKEKIKDIKICLADPQGSSLHMKVLYGTTFSSREKEGFKERNPQRTMVEGIGLQWLTENFKLADIDDSFSITDQEVYDMAIYLVRREGLLVGCSSALHIVAACKIALEKQDGSRILTLICDDGTRHLSKFYNPVYWKENGFPFVEKSKEEIESLSWLKPRD